MTPFLAIWGFIQYGARAHHRCIEVIMIVRLIIGKTNEWGFGWVVISLDLERAFENVKLSELLKHWETAGVPTRIRYAVFKDITGTKFVR